MLAIIDSALKRPYGFIGGSRLTAAKNRFPPALALWQQEWCFTCVEDTYVVSVLDLNHAFDEAVVTTQKWQKINTDRGSIWLTSRADPAWLLTLLPQIRPAITRDEIAICLIEQAALALVNRLLHALDLALIITYSGAVEEISNACAAKCILVRFSGAQCALEMVLEARLLDHLVAAPKRPHSLQSRVLAAATVKVEIQVALAFARIPLSTLSGLQVGDVLLADAHLAEPFQLHIRPEQAVAKGYLVQIKGQRGFQLDTA